jgi:peptide/nickel transport system substrate-binding protein
MDRRTFVASAAALPGALALADALTVTSADAATSTPTHGGSITTVSQAFLPVNFDPGTSNIDSYFAMVYDTLMYTDTVSGQVKPRVAQSLSSTDATVWTLKLRPNVLFTDGTPYDAAAVMFNLNRIGAPTSTAQVKVTPWPIASMTVVDPQTLKINLTGPLGSFPETLAGLSYIASPAALQKYGTLYGTSPSTTVGAGPFTVTSFVTGTKVVMSANPNYWDKPKPYIDTLTFELITVSAQAFNALQTGQAQVLSDSAYADIQSAKSSGLGVLSLPPANFALRYLFNFKKPPFNNLKARQAMNYALDMKKVNDFQNQGHGIVFTGPYSKASEWYMPSIKLPQYNPKKAQQLFNEAATELGGPVTFDFIYPVASGASPGDMMSTLLQPYQNVKINNLATTPSLYITKVLQGAWELVLFGISGAPNYVNQNFGTGSPQNYGGYSNPKVDQGAQIGQTAVTIPARRAGYTQAFKQLMIDLPAIWFPVASTTNAILHAKSVQGLTYSALEGQSSALHVRFDQLYIK